MSAGLRQGKNPLSYLGVDATTPPMMIVEQRDPTNNDSAGYDIGSLWLVTSVPKMWVMITKDPAAPSKWVQVYPGDGSGTNFFETDSGTALENAGTIKFLGSASGISVTGSGDTVTVSLDNDLNVVTSLTVATMTEGVLLSDSGGLLSSVNGSNLQFLVARTGIAPSFTTLVSEDGSIAFADGTAPGTVNIQAVGGGGGGNFAGLMDTTGNLATPLADKVTIAGYVDGVGWSNITSTAASHTITLKLNDVILLPATELSVSPKGMLVIGDSIVHFRGLENVFIGVGVGEAEDFNVVSATNNVGIGYRGLRALETSSHNVAIGNGCLQHLVSGSGSNVCIGNFAGSDLVSGGNNLLLGDNAGTFLRGAEHDNILISNSGNIGINNRIKIGSNHTDCYIAGIYGSSGLDSTNGVTLIDIGNKLVSSRGTTGQVLTSTATGVEWATPSADSSHYAFYAYQGESVAWSLPYGTDYLLGTKAVFEAPLNEGSAFYVGDGISTPISYTALATGIYVFNLIVAVHDEYKTGQTSIWKNVGLNLYTPARNYFQSFLQPYGGSSTNFSYTFLWNWTVTANLTVGDVATFGVTYNPEGGSPSYTYKVLGVGSGGRGGIATSISGYKL